MFTLERLAWLIDWPVDLFIFVKEITGQISPAGIVSSTTIHLTGDQPKQQQPSQLPPSSPPPLPPPSSHPLNSSSSNSLPANNQRNNCM